jgi:uncharacterized LabA/DUF88 family protein
MIHTDHLPGEQDSSVGGSSALPGLGPSSRIGPPWRASFYVDGFNLYHAIDDLGDHRLKWLDLRSLCTSFLTAEDQLISVHFFTALNRWDAEKRDRHVAYLTALQQRGVIIELGAFDRPKKYCWDKNDYCRNYSEKKTDVAIAVSLLGDGYEDKYDKAFLVSADSDQVPLAQRFRASLPNKRLLHIAPPNRYSEARELADEIGRSFQLTAGRIHQHLLPAEFRDERGRLIVARPAHYGPHP